MSVRCSVRRSAICVEIRVSRFACRDSRVEIRDFRPHLRDLTGDLGNLTRQVNSLPGHLSAQFREAGLELVGCDLVALLGSLPHRIRDGIGLGRRELGVGERTRDGVRVEHVPPIIAEDADTEGAGDCDGPDPAGWPPARVSAPTPRPMAGGEDGGQGPRSRTSRPTLAARRRAGAELQATPRGVRPQAAPVSSSSRITRRDAFAEEVTEG